MFAVAPRFLFCRPSTLLPGPAAGSRWYSAPAGVRSFPLLQELRARELVAEVTSEGLARQLQSPTVLYTGFDPTATSLHVGNLITLLGLLHFHLRGHKVIVVVGGATGSIGDPSGRSSERNALSREVLERNVDCIRSQLDRLLSTAAAYAANRVPGRRPDAADSKFDARPLVLNNLDWFASIPVLDFLGGIGRHARVNAMLDRESVKTRLDSCQGMSFTEFSYQLLQAYDFWHLHKTYGCMLQLGGSDQWGNINAGRDLIHRKYVEKGTASGVEREPEVFGLTIPLLTTSSGEKFGKSAGNAVWLDEQQTSVYDFYQFFMHTKDADLLRYLKMFTMLSVEECQEVYEAHMANADQRIGPTRLASEVTELVHGTDGLRRAQTASQVLFPPRSKSRDDTSYMTSFKASEVLAAFKGDPRLRKLHSSQVRSQPLVNVAVAAGVYPSKSEARRRIKQGGLYCSNRQVPDANAVISEDDLIDQKICLLRAGKSSYVIVELVDG